MSGGNFPRRIDAERDDAPPDGAPLGGTKAEATQRLQVGLAGLGSMVLLIGLASVLGQQADITEDASVPDAAPTTEPTETAQQRDPLADAGIVPEIPVEPAAEELEEPADLDLDVVEDTPADADAATDE